MEVSVPFINPLFNDYQDGAWHGYHWVLKDKRTILAGLSYHLKPSLSGE